MPDIEQPTNWGCPISIDKDNNTLNNFVTTPSRICGFVLDLMRLKFSNPNNIYHERLRVYTYDKDPLKTHIKIEPGFEYLDVENLANVQPGIIVNPEETQVLPVGNGSSQNPIGIVGDFFNTVNDFSMFGGSVVINAVSPGGLESLLLAEDVFLWLLLYQYTIRDDLNLSKFTVNVLKGPQKADSGRPCFISSVQLDWATAIGFSTNTIKPSFSEDIVKETNK